MRELFWKLHSCFGQGRPVSGFPRYQATEHHQLRFEVVDEFSGAHARAQVHEQVLRASAFLDVGAAIEAVALGFVVEAFNRESITLL